MSGGGLVGVAARRAVASGGDQADSWLQGPERRAAGGGHQATHLPASAESGGTRQGDSAGEAEAESLGHLVIKLLSFFKLSVKFVCLSVCPSWVSHGSVWSCLWVSRGCVRVFH